MLFLAMSKAASRYCILCGIVACIQLAAGSIIWTWTTRIAGLPMDEATMALIVSMSGGALIANMISVILLIGETLRPRR